MFITWQLAILIWQNWLSIKSVLSSTGVRCRINCLFKHFDIGAQWCERFLEVGGLDWAVILLGLAFYLPSVSVSSVFIV